MFLRLFMYNARLMLRSRDGLFWTVLYPILLASLYVAAFSSMFNFSQNKITVGIEADNPLRFPLSFVSILDVHEVTEGNADEALNNKMIEGFVQKDFSLRVIDDGINQSIIKSVLEQIKQSYALGVPIDPLDYNKEYIKTVNQKNNSPLILFYSLLSMVALYGMFGAISLPFFMQANISKLGARISTTPLNRFVSYISGIAFYALFNFASNILYILFVTYVLKIQFINNLSMTLAVLLIANIFGATYGIFIGSLPFGDENGKTMFCIFSSLGLAFLSGMMSPAVKLAIDKHIPLLNKINPIGLLTDNLYNVNILQEYDLLHLFGIVFIGATSLFLIAIFVNARKVQYDSL